MSLALLRESFYKQAAICDRTSERIKVTEAEVVYVAVDANRRKMKINRDHIKGDVSGIEQHETE